MTCKYTDELIRLRAKNAELVDVIKPLLEFAERASYAWAGDGEHINRTVTRARELLKHTEVGK